MQVLPAIVFLLGVLIPVPEPALAGDAPPSVARDIEILNRMLQQRKSSSSAESPSPAAPASPAIRQAVEPDAGRIEQLIGVLDDDAKEARKKARQELVAIGAPAVPALIVALEDPAVRVRIEAAVALGAIRDPRAAAPLAVLLGSPVPGLWDAAYYALQDIGDPGVPALLDALQTPNDTLRGRIVLLLSVIRGSAATGGLIALLTKDRSTDVRVESAAALGKIRDRAACDALLDALHDWSAHVRGSAGTALEQITGQTFGSDEDAWRRWWRKNGDDFLAASRTEAR